MSAVNKLFVGMDVMDGVGKVKNTYKNSVNNKYDRIMGTQPIKTTNILGQNNAVNGKINYAKRESIASEELDEMYKVASLDDFLKGMRASKDKVTQGKNNVNGKINSGVNSFKNKTGINKDNIKKVKRNVKKKYVSFVRGTRNDFRSAATNINAGKSELKRTLADISRSKYSSASTQARNQFKSSSASMKNGLKSFGKGMVKSTPAIAGMAGVGYGAYRTMKHFEDKKPVHERNDLYPKAVGVTLSGALAASAIVSKNPYRAFDVASKSMGKVFRRVPENMIKSTGPVGRYGVDVAKQVKKRTGEMLNQASKKSSKGAKKMYKRASDELDFFLEKNAKTYNLKQFSKSVLKDNVIKGGTESIFYFGVPSAISYAIGRDMRRGGTKLNKGNKKPTSTVVIDIPLEKKAMDVNISPKVENIIRRSADGVGRVFIPGAVSAIVGRNIMDNMKKINDNNDDVSIALNKELPDNKARVIIQTPTHTGISKKAEIEENQGTMKTSDILNALHTENLNNLGLKKLNKSDVKLYNGVKKKKRMFV